MRSRRDGDETSEIKGLSFSQGSPSGRLNDNHPVLQSMRDELEELQSLYRHEPSDFNRYQLVRQEQRIAQWATAELVSA